MKTVTRDQALEFIAKIAPHIRWDALDHDTFQKLILERSPRELGERITDFLQNGARLIQGELRLIPLDSSRSDDPSYDYGFRSEILEQDGMSLSRTELDLTKLKLWPMVEPDGRVPTSAERWSKISEAGYYRLGGQEFLTLNRNRFLLPESWKEPVEGMSPIIAFEGIVTRGPSIDGDCRDHIRRVCPAFYWKERRWDWINFWLDEELVFKHLYSVVYQI